MHRRLLLGATIAIAILASSAPATLAYPPIHDSWAADETITTLDLCPFEVTVHYRIAGDYTMFLDSTGSYPVKWIERDVEQDVFSANGKTLTGEPFRFTGITILDADGIISQTALGGIERVPLPDGTMFWSAGRFIWTDHPGITFTLAPDQGHSGNIDAFCAALS